MPKETKPSDGQGPWSKTASLLSAYFSSGWAFLIPYLAAYLLYAWLKWPVNAKAVAGAELGGGGFPMPLLHLYWIFHAAHTLLGGFALAFWWRKPATMMARGTAISSFALDRIWPIAPWFCLALLFWLPGVYLEYPADPWEHYARINQWRDQAEVLANPTWVKSSYFLAYSFVGRVFPIEEQLQWFDAYYTACCLLLCWQYYRLARAARLGTRASLVVVFLQALLLGNNTFGFYRYYGMSSSIFAQLGAMALIRIALEAFPPHPRPDHLPAYSALVPCGLLLSLIAFNHDQGLGLAGLGLGAITMWRLIAWRRSAGAWLALTALVLSLLVVFFYPRNAATFARLQDEGWLTSWGGFAVLSPGSPATSRVIQILGLAGLVNLGAGLLLLRRNHVVGWLTVFPFFALSLPLFAIPLAKILTAPQFENIVVFARFLLGIPTGLALVALATASAGQVEDSLSRLSRKRIQTVGPCAIAGVLLLLVALPAGYPCYDRLWNALAVAPADKMMTNVTNAVSASFLSAPASSDHARDRFLSSDGVAYIAQAAGIQNVSFADRLVPHASTTLSPAASAQRTADALTWPLAAILFVPAKGSLFSPASQAAQISGHWNPRAVSLAHAAGAEWSAYARQQGARALDVEGGTFYIFDDHRVP